MENNTTMCTKILFIFYKKQGESSAMKKRNARVLSMLLATSMVLAQAVGTLAFTPMSVQAEENAEPIRGEVTDEVNAAWAQDEATRKGEDSICVAEDGWLHLKASAANGNGTADSAENALPAVFVNPNNFDFSKDGYFEAAIKSGTPASETEFGIYLGYTDAGNGMFIGYDADGWFWQKYQNAEGERYSGQRAAAPEQGVETVFRIDWTADKKVTLTVDGQSVFEEEFSSLTNLTDNIAIKVATCSGIASDVYMKDIHYGSQEVNAVDLESCVVSGKVIDGEGNIVEGAEVTVAAGTVQTDADGNAQTDAAGTAQTDTDGGYQVSLPGGEYSITVEKEGYLKGTGTVTVNQDVVNAGDIILQKMQGIATQMISSDQMDVYIAENFPSVVRYEMKQDLAGKIFYGQSDELNTIKIN